MEKVEYFQKVHYQRLNLRRQKRIATLGVLLNEKTLLEAGAGIGNHTPFFLDRNCSVTSTDGRADLVSVIKVRHPSVSTFEWDMESAPPVQLRPHQVVYCYGLLYHVKNPDFVLGHLAELTLELLLLETCVSFGNDFAINIVDEYAEDPTQAMSGKGCRPTRRWIFSKLKSLFPYAYVTSTQPWHEEFPVNWDTNANLNASLSRSVFVASRQPLSLGSLSDQLLMNQNRC